MSDLLQLTRRAALAGAAGAGGLMLAGCDQLSRSSSFVRVLSTAQRLNLKAQRLLLPEDRLAPQYAQADISPWFKPNGSFTGTTDDYKRMLDDGFESYRLQVGGLVRHPLTLSLAELRALPAKSQITRHDCVEGWSAIGGWAGVQLGLLLKAAQLTPQARYIVFHCADNLGGGGPSGLYYESIDLDDAFHPQTILAYDMNGQPLPTPHGAPLRLRLERQLGYKMAKYVMSVEAVTDYRHIGSGRGGFWEDRGYQWYAGI
ncbi:MAG TPA: molybdopterin-binding protein [Caulobacteraceae bacterium]|nr:molybdopterin-binding protein [Caulobacteraceae bacterium]